MTYDRDEEAYVSLSQAVAHEVIFALKNLLQAVEGVKKWNDRRLIRGR